MKKLLRIGVSIILLAGVSYLYTSGVLDPFTFANLKESQAQLIEWTNNQFALAISLYLIIYIITTALALPGAALMTLAGGALFGLGWGLVLVSLASTTGATLCFLGSRLLFRDWVIAKFKSSYEKIQSGLDSEGPLYLFSLRLIPLVPFFVINLVFGLTRMPVRQFFFVSQLGMLPGTLAYVNAGTQLTQIESPKDILSFSVLASFVFLGLVPWLAKLLLSLFKNYQLYRPYKKPKQFEYDVIVIGGGSAGLVSAYLGAALKSKVLLIEKHKMGGDCLYTGCVPSKALIRSSHVAHLFSRAKEFGLNLNASVQVDFAKVFSRIQSVIAKIEPNDSPERYTSLGVECVKGEAFVVDPYRVRLNEKILTTRNIILATGAGPLVAKIPGLEKVRVLTSENLWQLNEKLDSLLVVGGGAIGCEMAQSFQRLGVNVTLVERGDRLLAKEDPEASQHVFEALRKDGVQILFREEILSFSGDTHQLRASLASGKTLNANAVLFALGRKANVSNFGLEELKLVVRPNGTLQADDYLRTRFPNILACGDVTGPFQLTHAASYQAGVAVLNALFSPFKKFRADYSNLPWCTYTDPEVARLGLIESEALAQGLDFEIHRYDLEHLDRAICEGENKGFVKILTPKNSAKILGVTIVGPHAGDLMAEFTLAKRKNLTLNDILNTIHSYPTFAEANRFAAGVWRKAHQPAWGLRLLERFHAFRR